MSLEVKKNKISVIVPIYNAEKYLKQCVDSLIEQTLNDIEIILVDDGSTDNSLNTVKKMAEKYENIKYISQKNQGAIVARINGYKIATGEYIAFVDNDDFLEKEMYEKMYKYAKEIDADVAICNYKFYPQKPKNKKKWFNEYEGVVDYKFVNRNNLLWNKIVKREYLEQINIIDLFSKIGESAYSLVLIKTKKIVTINEELYNYRVGQKSLSSDLTNIAWNEKIVENSKNKLEIIKNTELEKKWSTFFQYGVFYSMFKMLLISAYNSKKTLYQKYKNDIKPYLSNKYCREKFEKDNGKLKAFVTFNLICKNYYITKIMLKIYNKGK